MIIVYILLVLLIILTLHLVILPLTKKRPVFIKGIEGALLLAFLFAIPAAFIHPVLYVIPIAIGFLIYYTKSWIVYGVSLENISSALERAILATRATSNKLSNGCEIDNNMTVKLTNIGMRICYIQYKSKAFSKKSELTKEIFRKFIQNYFI